MPRYVCLLVAVAALAVPSGGLVPRHATNGVIDVGEYVAYHATGFDASGRIVLTTNPDVARSAATDSRPPLIRNSTILPEEPIQGIIADRGTDSTESGRFRPSDYLIGHRVGDIIDTPLILNPFGSEPTSAIPTRIGPFESTISLDLDELYSADRKNQSFEMYGPRGVFAAGNSITYAHVLDGIITHVDDSIALIELQVAEARVVRSDVLGFDMMVTPDDGGRLWLEPQLVENQMFTTAGCGIPDAVIRPGSYTVVERDDKEIVLRRDMGSLEVLYDNPIQFTFEIMEHAEG